MQSDLVIRKSGIFVRRHFTNQTGPSAPFHSLSSPENIRAIILWGGISHVKLAYRWVLEVGRRGRWVMITWCCNAEIFWLIYRAPQCPELVAQGKCGFPAGLQPASFVWFYWQHLIREHTPKHWWIMNQAPQNHPTVKNHEMQIPISWPFFCVSLFIFCLLFFIISYQIRRAGNLFPLGTDSQNCTSNNLKG